MLLGRRSLRGLLSHIIPPLSHSAGYTKPPMATFFDVKIWHTCTGVKSRFSMAARRVSHVKPLTLLLASNCFLLEQNRISKNRPARVLLVASVRRGGLTTTRYALCPAISRRIDKRPWPPGFYADIWAHFVHTAGGACSAHPSPFTAFMHVAPHDSLFAKKYSRSKRNEQSQERNSPHETGLLRGGCLFPCTDVVLVRPSRMAHTILKEFLLLYLSKNCLLDLSTTLV